MQLQRCGGGRVSRRYFYPGNGCRPPHVAGQSRPFSCCAKFDPCQVGIPAGATFYIKTYATWVAGDFPLISGTACQSRQAFGEWTNLGNALSDQTLSTTAFPPVSSNYGFGPTVLGRLAAPSVVLGTLGDSITRAFGIDSDDPTLNKGFIGRAMRNAFPVYLVNRSGDTLTNFVRTHRGRQLMLQDAVTHLIIASCRNDLAALKATVAAGALQNIIGMFHSHGVRCYAFTALPTTKSTDGWATRANQTIAHPDQEPQRSLYNDWLRRDWRSVGLTGIFDVAAAVENKATGYWNADGAPGFGAAGYATLSAGSITGVSTGLCDPVAGGRGYPPDKASCPAP